MENQILRDGEDYSDQEYDNSNIIDMPVSQEDATKSLAKVSANISANVTPEHIKEVGNGFRKNKESINMLEAYSHLLSQNNISNENCELVMQHMDNVVNQSFQLKKLQAEKANVWKIILASSAGLCLCLIGSGYFIKCFRK